MDCYCFSHSMTSLQKVFWFLVEVYFTWASQVVLLVKNLPANAGDVRERCSFDPRIGRSPGGGHGNPLQYSCLEIPMDRETWQATVHWVTKNLT